MTFLALIVISIICILILIFNDNKVLKILSGIIIFINILAIIFLAKSFYVMKCKTVEVDRKTSPDGQYTLVLYSVGEPFLFGPAKGRILLKEGKKKVGNRAFSLCDDGGQVTPFRWEVSWEENYARIVITGEDQFDYEYMFFFDGNVEGRELNTHYGKELK